MGDGQSNKVKIGAIIQARMQSSRLPGKVLMPLPFPNGKPVLEHIIDNFQSTGVSNHTYVVSSENPENDAIEEFCKQRKIYCFRGSEHDVLSRFVHIVNTKNLDHVIRLTGDNPVLDKNCLRQVLKIHLQNNNDYTQTEGLPLGMNIEIIKGKCLVEASNDVNKIPEDIEHVTFYARRNDCYKKEIVKKESDLAFVRTTIDYPSDYAMMSLLLSEVEEPINSVDDIKSVLDRNSWMTSINKDAVQKPVFDSLNMKIQFAYDLLRKYDLAEAAEVLRMKYDS